MKEAYTRSKVEGKQVLPAKYPGEPPNVVGGIMLSFGIGPFRFGKLVYVLALACLPGLAQQNVPDAPQPKPSSQPSQFPEGAPQAPKNDHAEPPPVAASTPTPAAQATRGPENEILS